MSMEPLELHGAMAMGPLQRGPERELVSGEEIRRRVQERIDAHPELRRATKHIIAPMPKPTAHGSPTGCNWTMHYLGQFPGYERQIDDIVELVQFEANIAGPLTLMRAPGR